MPIGYISLEPNYPARGLVMIYNDTSTSTRWLLSSSLSQVYLLSISRITRIPLHTRIELHIGNNLYVVPIGSTMLIICL